MTRLRINRSQIMSIHVALVYFYVALVGFHFLVSVFVLRYPWRYTIRTIRKGRWGRWTLLRFIQRGSAWLLFILSFIQVTSGLGWYSFSLYRVLSFQPHVIYDVFLASTLVIHVAVGFKAVLSRHRVKSNIANYVIALLALFLLTTGFIGDRYFKKGISGVGESKPELEHHEEYSQETPENTKPLRKGRITIGTKHFEFNPEEVKTTRPDIFKEGYFSMFDVLVHIAEKGLVDLQYHFDESMNTHIIDSLDGETFWWYITYYDGGWEEINLFRYDHYPWKEGTTLKFLKSTPSKLNQIYSIFREEVERRKANGGRVIVPRVTITGRTFNLTFHDVEVTAHDLRSDVFREGVITAIDVIMSLGDQEEIKYQLQWYESIGTAGIVKNYWVEGIDNDIARGRCGFVYESGDELPWRGNHIHLPSDTRVLNSPEYVWYFWICI